jgi:hypothetical protein
MHLWERPFLRWYQYAYLDIYSNYAEQETNIKWNPAENKRAMQERAAPAWLFL